VNKDNWDLGAKRAHAVFEYMNEKGIADERMVLTSRGFAQPVSNVDVNSKEGRSKCRRVEIRLKPTGY
jgi:flagellar motor protein MotB